MIKAIIDKNILIEKNTIQVNRILKDKEEFELNEDTDLLFENTYLFPFAKYEDNKIIELTEEEAKLRGLIKLQGNEAIINNKVIRLEIYERFENGKIITNEELKKERKDFIEFEEDTTELDKKIEEITKELEKLEV